MAEDNGYIANTGNEENRMIADCKIVARQTSALAADLSSISEDMETEIAEAEEKAAHSPPGAPIQRTYHFRGRLKFAEARLVSLIQYMNQANVW